MTNKMLDEKKKYNIELTGRDVEIVLAALGRFQIHAPETRYANGAVQITIDHVYKGIGVNF